MQCVRHTQPRNPRDRNTGQSINPHKSSAELSAELFVSLGIGELCKVGVHYTKFVSIEEESRASGTKVKNYIRELEEVYLAHLLFSALWAEPGRMSVFVILEVHRTKLDIARNSRSNGV
jgi:hypothetical protein